MKTILATAFVALPCAIAAAQEQGFPTRTVGDLAAICAGNESGRERVAAENFCDGYAQGLMSIVIDKERNAICVPANAPPRRATMRDFVTWANASEQRKSTPAARGLLSFFQERFPCQR